MQKVVSAKRYNDSEVYYFLQNIEGVKVGDQIFVDLNDFKTLCQVTKVGLEFQDDKAADLPKIVRVATEADIKKYEFLLSKAKSELPEIKKKSLALGLMMKFVSAQYSMDNSKILIVFSSEERVDFRQLLKDLASMLKTRIELKQIGQRDEVKCCGGVGTCGQQCCCARFLKNFEHVTVKMAKNQGLSLSPTKINGVCGRLLCCLAYESAMYEEVLAKMPKVGSEISTPNGKGTVVYNDILRERVSVKRQADGENFVVEEFTLDELNGKKKEQSDEEKHSGGGKERFNKPRLSEEADSDERPAAKSAQSKQKIDLSKHTQSEVNKQQVVDKEGNFKIKNGRQQTKQEPNRPQRQGNYGLEIVEEVDSHSNGTGSANSGSNFRSDYSKQGRNRRKKNFNKKNIRN